MEYKTNLENLIAAAYLSGAAEGLNKSKELTSEDLTKNLDDLKILRRTFLRRAEEEGYHQPVHHIEEAKKKAFELLTQKTKYPNTNIKKPFSLFGMFDKKTPNVSNVKSPNVSNVKTPNISNVKTPTFFNTNVSKAVNALANNTHVITTPPPSAAQYTPPVLSLGGKRKL